MTLGQRLFHDLALACQCNIAVIAVASFIQRAPAGNAFISTANPLWVERAAQETTTALSPLAKLLNRCASDTTSPLCEDAGCNSDWYLIFLCKKNMPPASRAFSRLLVLFCGDPSGHIVKVAVMGKPPRLVNTHWNTCVETCHPQSSS